jgi:hypothetical protein
MSSFRSGLTDDCAVAAVVSRSAQSVPTIATEHRHRQPSARMLSPELKAADYGEREKVRQSKRPVNFHFCPAGC